MAERVFIDPLTHGGIRRLIEAQTQNLEPMKLKEESAEEQLHTIQKRMEKFTGLEFSSEKYQALQQRERELKKTIAEASPKKKTTKIPLLRRPEELTDSLKRQEIAERYENADEERAAFVERAKKFNNGATVAIKDGKVDRSAVPEPTASRIEKAAVEILPDMTP